MLKGEYVPLYSGGYVRNDTGKFLAGLSESAMRLLIHKDIKASGFNITTDSTGHYICGYARQRAENMWQQYRFAQLPTDAQIKQLSMQYRVDWCGRLSKGNEDVEV